MNGRKAYQIANVCLERVKAANSCLSNHSVSACAFGDRELTICWPIGPFDGDESVKKVWTKWQGIESYWWAPETSNDCRSVQLARNRS